MGLYLMDFKIRGRVEIQDGSVAGFVVRAQNVEDHENQQAVRV